MFFVQKTYSLDAVKKVHRVQKVWDLGYRGEGVGIAIIDTGINANHVGLNDFDDDKSTNDPKVIAFYDPVNNPTKTEVDPYDDQGHGSHVAGIAAGTGAPNFEHVGIAPQANLIGVKILDAGGSGSFETVMAGMKWVVENQHKFNIRVAVMSPGGLGAIKWTPTEEATVNRMANEMMINGIALFVAAGNSAITAQIK